MVSANLVVPVVLWGPNAPTHCIASCVYLLSDQQKSNPNSGIIITGCYDGQIILWTLESGNGSCSNMKMTPRFLLVGHSAPVLCLTRASILPENNFLVSVLYSVEQCSPMIRVVLGEFFRKW